MIIVGLCLDNGESLTSKFFNTKIMQFCGRISMSLYLIHEPLIFYIRLIYWEIVGNPKQINGVWQWEGWEGPNASPFWTVPIHFIISLIFATLITLYLEEPARKKLKRWREKKKQLKKDEECYVRA